MIIQNAIKIWDGNKIIYLLSKHRHDFQPYTFDNGKSLFVDGGNEYLRRGGSAVNFDATQEVECPTQDWSLDDSQTIYEIAEKLLWGCRGKNGNESLHFLPLCVLETAHLKAILKTQPQIKGKLHEKVIKLILKTRKEKLDKSPKKS